MTGWPSSYTQNWHDLVALQVWQTPQTLQDHPHPTAMGGASRHHKTGVLDAKCMLRSN